MGFQIFGTKKCKDTQKAIRFFKERNISVHFVDLTIKGPSAGELDNISRSVPLEDLIDVQSKEYKKQNLEYMTFDIREKLLEYPILIQTPIVRNGKQSTVGYQPEVWKNWL